MGFFKGGLFVIVSVLFFVALLTMNSFLVISFSLDYDNIKTDLTQVVQDTLKENINLSSVINTRQYPLMQKFCSNSSQELEYFFTEKNYSFSVSCSTIANGTDAVFDEVIDNFVYEQYYKEYSCDYWKCFNAGETPFFIVSQHSADYWQKQFYFSLLVSLVLFGLMFLFVEKKTNLPLVAGVLVILSSLLFVRLEALTKWAINALLTLPISPEDYLKFFTVIFNQSSKVFYIMLVLGIILLAAGIIMKFFAIGFKINSFFSKFASKKESGNIEKEVKKTSDNTKGTSKYKKK
ncbi:MAG: hypothetical protein WD876_00555 [Candidatus Pacearchaeota archaeon]